LILDELNIYLIGIQSHVYHMKLAAVQWLFSGS